jgi:hypothetical protein
VPEAPAFPPPLDDAGMSEAISALSLARATLGWRNCTEPVSFTPCSANTILARSTPTVRIAMDFPFRMS